MQKLIPDYYNIIPKPISLEIYKGIFNFIKRNTISQKKIIIPNYKQKLVTDYYLFIKKDKIKNCYSKLRQPLITNFYHKN